MKYQHTRLSVNVNKIALLRNSRGGDRPDLIQWARDIQTFGAEGITIHPRPDERHIKFSDILPLQSVTHTEFNIEGYPNEKFLKAVLACRPNQCTLVPDPPGVLTSDSGWDTKVQHTFLQDVLGQLKAVGIRTAIFIDSDPEHVLGAKLVGADRVELYTGDYAKGFYRNAAEAVAPHSACAQAAESCGIGLNAGHDLDLDNLAFYKKHLPNLLEVSIGHAIVADALTFGMENVIQMYKRKLTDIPD